MNRYDAIVVGAGPAGSVCAATLARGGRRVLLLDRASFPRDKVCGDCLNPAAWPVIDRLELRPRLVALPHVAAREVSFHGIRGKPLRFPVPAGSELVVKRRDLDALLVERARELGVDFRDGTAVLRTSPEWTVETDQGLFAAPRLIAADGRNSAVSRISGRLPAAGRDRTALQGHARRPASHGDDVRMIFYPGGYGGTAAVSVDEINVCLVAAPRGLAEIRRRAEAEFGPVEWRTIAPLARADGRPLAADGLFLVGDAARVVEPFTGEGIYYAMRSGELAAEAILAGGEESVTYARAHAALYRGRLWINRLARFAGEHPRLASATLRLFPALVKTLTAKVVPAAPQT